VTAVAFLPAQRAVSGGEDESLILWDLESGSELKRVAKLDGEVNGLAVSRDGTRLIVAVAGLRIFDASTLAEIERVPLKSGSGAPWCVAMCPDGRSFAAGTHDGFVYRFVLD